MVADEVVLVALVLLYAFGLLAIAVGAGLVGGLPVALIVLGIGCIIFAMIAGIALVIG